MNSMKIEDELRGLGQRAISSALVLGARRILFQFIVTGSTIVLARLLLPEVFGVFAIVMFIIAIFGFFCDIGFVAAIVQQKEDPSANQLRGVFTIQLLLSLVITGCLWLLAPLIIGYYGGQLPKESVFYLRLLVLNYPLGIGSAVSKSLLERNLSYTKFAIGEFAGLVVGKGLAIILALSGFGLLALVYAEFVSRLVGALAFFLLAPWPVGFSFRFRQVSSLIAFGFPFQLAAIIGLINGAVIPFYIGAFPGPGGWNGAQVVGFITFAAGLAGFSKFFSEIISQLVFPVISRAQGDTRRVQLALERALEISALASFGLIAVIFGLGKEIIAIVYTDKWFPSLTVLRLLLLQSAETSIGLVLANALLALGASRVYRNLNIFWAALQWALTIPLVLAMGFVGLGFASVMVSATGVLIPWWFLRRKFRFRFFSTFLPEAGVALLTLLLVLILRQVIVVRSIWTLLFLGGLGITLYGVMIYIFLRRSVISMAVYTLKLLRKEQIRSV